MAADCIEADVAHAIWDLLVAEAGAEEQDRDAFVAYLTDSHAFGYEYRFMGSLGFGGKLYYTASQGAYIGCYSEHRTDERAATIERVNQRLREIAA